MRIPPFWRGRLKGGPASAALTRFRAVLEAAYSTLLYRDRFFGLDLQNGFHSINDITGTLAAVQSVSYEQYRSTFPDLISPLQDSTDTFSSAVILPYQEARAGLRSWLKPVLATTPYGLQEIAQATTDLYHLAQAIAAPSGKDWQSDHAVVAWSALDSGVLTSQQRDQFWDHFEVPLFEHLVGCDGTVIAAECEVHAGLHVRPDSAILECIGGEIVFTSLTDVRHPALRVRTGLAGDLESNVCDCGSAEPRLMALAVHSDP